MAGRDSDRGIMSRGLMYFFDTTRQANDAEIGFGNRQGNRLLTAGELRGRKTGAKSGHSLNNNLPRTRIN